MPIRRRLGEYIVGYSYSRIWYNSENDTAYTYPCDESPVHTEWKKQDTEGLLGWVYLRESSNTGKTKQIIVCLYS